MTPSEIIKQEAQRVGYDADILMRKIHRLVESKVGLLLQKNDSLLLLITIGKGLAELHIFTVDTPDKVAEAIKYFIEKIRNSDLKRVYGPGGNSQDKELKKTLRLLKSLGVDVQDSDLKQYSWMAPV